MPRDAIIESAELHPQPAAEVPAREDLNGAVQGGTSDASSPLRPTRTRRRPPRWEDSGPSAVRTSVDPSIGEVDLQQQPSVVTF